MHLASQPELKLIDLSKELPLHLSAPIPPWLYPTMERFLGVEELNRTYREVTSHADAQHSFFATCLQTLRIDWTAPNDTSAIPETGPAIIVANHPYGLLDGLILGELATRVRGDVRILANHLLGRVPELSPHLLPVDVLFGGLHQNTLPLRAAHKHLQQGGLLIVFPAGEVASFQPKRGDILDPEWNPVAARLARRTGASIVPAYFSGKNGATFHLAGMVHPSLRTMLLPRELLAKRGTSIRVSLGTPLSPALVRSFTDDKSLNAWMRLRTYALQKAVEARVKKSSSPLTSAQPPEALTRELASLPDSTLLLEQGHFQLRLFEAADAPRLMDEIARLREVTFRAVGEGTGLSRDRDPFDEYYEHLLLWDNRASQVVGAYRLARCDRVLQSRGLRGLYTSQLFHYEAAMEDELMNAIELGRSFVRAEYQRHALPLALLWRGIGATILRYKHYTRLCGAVSISDTYRGSSRRLLLAKLHELHGEPTLARWVRSRHPVKERLNPEERLTFQSCRNQPGQLERLLNDLHPAGRGVPVLVDRYLELGGRFLGLSVDPQFGSCIDGLVVVEMADIPERILQRFVGREGALQLLR